MAETREKLLELFQSGDCPLILCCGGMERLANYLITNGVTIPVRCKECKHHEHYDALLYCGHIRGLAGSVSPDDYCSYGERKDNDV